jgi:ribose 5-phosphate isomerase RpiB
MRVAFGSDHAGFSLKGTLTADHADFGAPVGRAVTTAALARPDRALVHNSEGTP